MEHAVLRCTVLQTDRAVKEKRRPWLLIKSTTVSSIDYTAMGKLHREDTPATSTAERCRVAWLELSNKAYSRRSLNTSVHINKNDKTFLMEMIDRLFTEKCWVFLMFRYVWAFCEGCFLLFGCLTPGQDLWTDPNGEKAREVKCCINQVHISAKP